MLRQDAHTLHHLLLGQLHRFDVAHLDAEKLAEESVFVERPSWARNSR
jgi:hypothetical protein